MLRIIFSYLEHKIFLSQNFIAEAASAAAAAAAAVEVVTETGKEEVMLVVSDNH